MGALHPQVVHFTIVLVIVGVAFRLVSLLGRPALAFTGPAAAVLLILAGGSAYFAARSGIDAHGPVERVPGSRPAVVAHEEWGVDAHFIVAGLGVIELAGLALRRWPRVKIVHGLSAAVGLVGVFYVYEAAKHGGELVYNYAGGVGIRSGDPKDTERLLLAGLYHQAMADRAAGQGDRAAALITAAVKRFPTDVEVNLLAAESMLLDQKNPLGTLATLARVNVPTDNRILSLRQATLQADAFEAAGEKDEAVMTLESVLKRFPNPRLQTRLDALRSGAAPASR
jgi:uncharacterized membrane protein